MKYAVKIKNFDRGNDGWLRYELKPEDYPRYYVQDTVNGASTWPSRILATEHIVKFSMKYPKDWDYEIVLVEDNKAAEETGEIAMTLDNLKDIRRAVAAHGLPGSKQILFKIDMAVGQFKDNQGIIDSITTTLAHLHPEHDKELIDQLRDKLKSMQSPDSIIIRVIKD
jgi:hypothetical protein